MASTASGLRTALSEIANNYSELLARVPVKGSERDYGHVIVVAPQFYWAPRTPEQQNQQLQIKRRYEEWIELVRSLFRNAPQDLAQQIVDADRAVRIWIEFGSNWSLQRDIETNEREFRKDVGQFSAVLDVFNSADLGETIVIPDTNSLVAHPDPAEYRALTGTNSFRFLLLATVLAELDELKNLHRNPDFREKVLKTIQRIKGWRNQGSLRDGVTVDKSITVQASANEPRMKESLSWLDAEVADDRLIASVLEVHASNPDAHVILVTGDINLLNKAEAACVTTAELP
jgi:hypothetical protein